MAQVPKTSLKQFKDGPPPVKAADLNQNNEVLRTAINDNDGRIGAVEADGSVTTAKLANGAVTTVKLGDNAVTAPKIAANAVTTDKLLDRSVTAPKIGLTAVGTEHLQDLSVTSSKLAEGAITSTKLGSNAVNSTALVDGAVTTSKLAELGISTTKLGNNVVTSEKLADGSVTDAKLGSNSVTTAKIADKAITSAKLADNAVTPAGLNVYTKPETDKVIADALAGGLPQDVIDEITQSVAQDVADLKTEVDGIETDVFNLKEADVAMQAEITALQNAVPPDASTTQKGIVKLSNAISGTSQTDAVTPYALKSVYDLAVAGMRLRNVNNGTDLNTLTQIGVYRIVEKSKFPNAPDDYGILQVNSDTPGYVTQTFTAILTARTYTRGRNESGTWTAWNEVALSPLGDVKSPMVFRGQVAGDFNNYNQTGYYIVAFDNWVGATNFPRDNTVGNAYPYGVLEVMNSGQALSQIYRVHSDSRVWSRGGYSNGSWQGWKRLLTTDDYDTLFQLSVDTKGKVATAINGKGGTANSGMTGDQLAAAITNIPTAKISEGSITTPDSIYPDAGANVGLPAKATVSYTVPAGFPISKLFISLGGYTYYASSGWTNTNMPNAEFYLVPGGSRSISYYSASQGFGGEFYVTLNGSNTITISMTTNFVNSTGSRYYKIDAIKWWAIG